jgi:tetratricopeptide (TPR) repeat protein
VANFYGYLLAEKGEKLDFAEKLVREALAKEPQNGYFLDSLGWIKFKRGRYEEALNILLKATESAKDDAVIWEHLGDTYVRLSDAGKAAKAYKKSLSIDPKGKGVAEKMDRLQTSGKLHK